MTRNYKGQYARSNDAFSLVLGVLLLGTLWLVLNHFNGARLDEYSKANCIATTGNADCSPATITN